MGGEWRKVRVSEVAQVTSGKRPGIITKVRTPECAVPVYGGGGISGYTTRPLYRVGALVTGRVGTLGNLFAPKQDFWPTDNTLVIVPISPDVEKGFFRYSLEPAIPQLAAMNRGAANPLIIQGDVKRLSILLPPLPEQRAIARILGTLDDKIELNRRMNETLEAMAQALFKSWFVDFDPVVVNALKAGNPVPEKFAERAAHYRENPGALGLSEETLRLFPDRFVDSELGPIPAGWRASKVGDEFDITMGQSPPGSTYNEIGHGLPFFQGRRDFGFRYPTNRVYCTAPKRVVNAGDTLVSVRAPVGDINMAYETCAIGRGVAAVRHKSGSRSYTYYAMRALGELFRRYEAGGTVFGAINKKQFHDLPNIAPKHNLVSLFEDEMYPFDAKIRSFEEQSRTLAALRDTLLPKLISGEVRVPDAEKILEEAL